MGDYDELKRLAEAATPGPWLYDRDGEEGSVWTRQPHTGELARTAPEDINGEFPAHANAAFIAAANPATVLALLSEIAALRDREKSALKECSDWARQAGEAIGKLEASEMAGVVDGWRDRATEAERRLTAAVRLNDRAADLMRQCTDPERFEGASTLNVYANMRAWLSDQTKEAT